MRLKQTEDRPDCFWESGAQWTEDDFDAAASHVVTNTVTNAQLQKVVLHIAGAGYENFVIAGVRRLLEIIVPAFNPYAPRVRDFEDWFTSFSSVQMFAPPTGMTRPGFFNQQGRDWTENQVHEATVYFFTRPNLQFLVGHAGLNLSNWGYDPAPDDLLEAVYDAITGKFRPSTVPYFAPGRTSFESWLLFTFMQFLGSWARRNLHRTAPPAVDADLPDLVPPDQDLDFLYRYQSFSGAFYRIAYEALSRLPGMRHYVFIEHTLKGRSLMDIADEILNVELTAEGVDPDNPSPEQAMEIEERRQRIYASSRAISSRACRQFKRELADVLLTQAPQDLLEQINHWREQLPEEHLTDILWDLFKWIVSQDRDEPI